MFSLHGCISDFNIMWSITRSPELGVCTHEDNGFMFAHLSFSVFIGMLFLPLSLSLSLWTGHAWITGTTCPAPKRQVSSPPSAWLLFLSLFSTPATSSFRLLAWTLASASGQRVCGKHLGSEEWMYRGILGLKHTWQELRRPCSAVLLL